MFLRLFPLIGIRVETRGFSELLCLTLTEFSVGTYAYCRNLVILLTSFFVAGCVGWSVLDEESFEVARNFQ